MYKESDQMTEFNQSAMDTALQLTEIALNSTERLVGLQWISTKQSLADAQSVLQIESDLWDLPTLIGLRTKLTEKSVENASVYLRTVYEVAAYTKDQIADLFTARWREWSKTLNSQFPLVVYASAHSATPQPVQAQTQSVAVVQEAEQILPAPEVSELVSTPIQVELPAEMDSEAVAGPVEAPLTEAHDEPISVSEPLEETPVLQAEPISVSEPLEETPVLQAEPEAMTPEHELPAQTVAIQADTDTPALAHSTTLSASDFSGAYGKPAPQATRTSKTTKPAAEKAKPAPAKKKASAKR